MFPPFSLVLLFLSSPFPLKNAGHQKQLRLIHEKFKEEVNLHLKDCRGTVESLEADQMEIKGVLEKQSMIIYNIYIYKCSFQHANVNTCWLVFLYNKLADTQTVRIIKDYEFKEFF